MILSEASSRRKHISCKIEIVNLRQGINIIYDEFQVVYFSFVINSPWEMNSKQDT